jgi:hydrogenase expression/formation protein HypC
MCLAVPGKIVRFFGDDPLSRTAEVDFSGAKKVISMSFVPDAQIGDYVIVHVGFALSVLDETEALESLRYFAQLDDAAKPGGEA